MDGISSWDSDSSLALPYLCFNVLRFLWRKTVDFDVYGSKCSTGNFVLNITSDFQYNLITSHHITLHYITWYENSMMSHVCPYWILINCPAKFHRCLASLFFILFLYETLSWQLGMIDFRFVSVRRIDKCLVISNAVQTLHCINSIQYSAYKKKRIVTCVLI
jgi:hypothetical protein